MHGAKFFDAEMKSFFGAEEGAYTVFTAEELRKRSFNVKAKIRDLLCTYLGEENIPRANVTEKQTIRFRICDKAGIWESGYWDIPCKFSKPNSREMSIYFLNEHISGMHAKPGDYWYVYFRKDLDEPYVGVFSKELWVDIFNKDEEVAPDKETRFLVPVEELNIAEVPVPTAHHSKGTGVEKTSKALSPDQAAFKEKNNKLRGNRAEEIALEIEKKRIKAAGRSELLSKIIPVAKTTDGLGYDIRSIDIQDDGSIIEIFIEVKGTSGGINTPFHVSKRELEVSQRLREAYYLYRIFNMSESSSSVEYYKVKGALDKVFNLTPESYWAENKDDE